MQPNNDPVSRNPQARLTSLFPVKHQRRKNIHQALLLASFRPTVSFPVHEESCCQHPVLYIYVLTLVPPESQRPLTDKFIALLKKDSRMQYRSQNM